MSTEKQQFIRSLIFPSFFLILIWLIKAIEITTSVSYSDYGIYPLKLEGLIGIVTAPLLHADIKHLLSNSIPVFLLSVGLFYFYYKIAWSVFFLTYFTTGLWVWLIGRGGSCHIGASGIVYALASFLFFSGVFRRDNQLMAISLLVSFLYGGMIWGIFPTKEWISWESHLMGFFSGIVFAYFLRNYGPQRTLSEIELEEEDTPDEHYIQSSTLDGFEIKYPHTEDER